MLIRKIVDEDKTGTIKNMLLLMALYALAGGMIGVMAVLMTTSGCSAAGKQLIRDVESTPAPASSAPVPAAPPSAGSADQRSALK